MSDLPILQCKSGDTESENRWFRHCKSRRIPFVVVRRRTKYAEVHWDCISLPHAADNAITNDSDVIRDRLLATFHRFASTKSKHDFSAYTGSFDNLDPIDAKSAAAEVFETLSASLKV